MNLIIGTANISAIFAIFHDGVIERYVSNQGNLYLTVDISYLAQLVQPGYCSFHVALHDVADVTFATWPKSAQAHPSVLTSLADIFIPALSLLSGEPDGNAIKVICNQPARDSLHCGGELRFRAWSACVTDAAGKQYALAELEELSRTYWDAWKERNGNRGDANPS